MVNVWGRNKCSDVCPVRNATKNGWLPFLSRKRGKVASFSLLSCPFLRAIFCIRRECSFACSKVSRSIYKHYALSHRLIWCVEALSEGMRRNACCTTTKVALNDINKVPFFQKKHTHIAEASMASDALENWLFEHGTAANLGKVELGSVAIMTF